jgi:hypothetical protein
MAINNKTMRGVSFRDSEGEILIPKPLVNPAFFMPAVPTDDKRAGSSHMTTGQKAVYSKAIVGWYRGGMADLTVIGSDGFFVPPTGKSKASGKAEKDMDSSTADKFLAASPADRIKMLPSLTNTDKAVIMGLGLDGIKALQGAMKG